MDAKLKKIELEFQDYLISCGGSLVEPTNPWELVRWVDYHGTHVVYYNSKKLYSYSDPLARAAFELFQNGGIYQATAIIKRVKRNLREDAIIKRDGEDCFFCGKPLGQDITLEHLLPIAKGGNNTLHNLVLCHERCNKLAGSLSIAEKVALRDRLREAERAKEFSYVS